MHIPTMKFNFTYAIFFALLKLSVSLDIVYACYTNMIIFSKWFSLNVFIHVILIFMYNLVNVFHLIFLLLCCCFFVCLLLLLFFFLLLFCFVISFCIPPKRYRNQNDPRQQTQYVIVVVFDQNLYCTVGMCMKVCEDRILVKSEILINHRKGNLRQKVIFWATVKTAVDNI